ncbi:sugar ABC transporter permease [Vibrio sp. Isolate25]|uniref:carbohydrate ABC transporter permease n=1 Tax=Vibrio TaxID=662 RepID=UPI001EFE5BCA|nr:MULTISPECIES: sugar ABC transporter permease [Vibrio]MCG9596041.1 sugar ABC transporter permease [Vibrio sp. Isolate25]MCG9677539.1 sugar ABC transporter permease [Vibrio sp. Isolate24]USD35067.1 sugar ABC transporter permease [Vibrio sp. SCSIO 43186]USD48133.1 sugar ABC transporter permease [Vibrio sp. SCSIO 43145]USD72192.1 sugar ABC transporter permease [Vibrio sp. SCSIO 43139]
MLFSTIRKDGVKDFFTFAFIPLFAFTTVLFIPFIMGIVLTFTNWNGFSFGEFVGLQNYVDAFSDENFLKIFTTTLKYVLYCLVFTNIIGFGLALLITSGIKGQNGLRSVFFMPNLIGGILLGFIWQFIFNRIFVTVGDITGFELLLEPWLSEPDKAFWALVIVSVWQQSGYMMLIYIAGIMGVQKSLLEAASIDGASKGQILRAIKIPMMMQSFTICLFLTLKNAFMMFDVNLALTNGGPYRSTELLTLNIYNEAFLYQNYGTAQAKAILLFVVVVIVALAQVYFTKKKEV